MAALDYVYNRSAANLRGADVGLIGLVINDLRNPFFTEFAASAQMTFARRGYATVIANTDESPAIQAQVVASMIEHGVSGFLISPAYVDEADGLEAVRRAGVPAMQVLRRIDARTDAFPFASLDYAAGGRLAARAPGRARGAADRLRRRARGPAGDDRADGGLPRGDGRGRAGGRRLPRPAVAGLRARHGAAAARRAAPEIEAAVCFNDLVALGMLAGFAEAGVRVGADFRLVGFDDIEECALDLAAAELGALRHRALRREARPRRCSPGSRAASGRPPAQLAPVELIARHSSLGG